MGSENRADQASDFLSNWFWIMGAVREAIMGLSPNVSVMRNPSILSATPSSSATSHAAPSPASSPGRVRSPARLGTVRFDACQIGVVLRAVLFVEVVVAVASLFLAPSFAEWLLLAATVT